MLRISICDDNQTHLRLAEDMVKSFFANKNTYDYATNNYSSAELLLADIDKNRFVPDIAILDIEMDGDNGITLAKKLNVCAPQCRIIFLTSYMQYAQDVYDAEHVWFVIKKDSDKYFPSAIEKALGSLKSSSNSVSLGILIRKGTTSTLIPLDQILYITKVARKTQIKCLNGVYWDTRRPALLISEKMEPFFLRCHQGYWVNTNMIQELDHETFKLKDGSIIPISRTFRETARKRFFERYL